MSRRLRLAVLVLVLGGIASSGAASLVRSNNRGRGQDALVTEARAVELDIAFYQRRLRRDSLAARDHGELARLYLQRSRRTGSQADLSQAESLARQSLALRSGRNFTAQQVLASSLMGQHRFLEAREVAARLVARDSAARGPRALLGEIELELGDYQAARRIFGSLQTVRADLSVAPRYARWAEIQGRPSEARALLLGARDQARRAYQVPASQLAWFQWRLGDLALRRGRLNEAEQGLGSGLDAAPEDYRLLSALARLAAVRHQWRTAIDYGERSLALVLDPGMLGLLQQAYAAVGDSSRAAEYDRALAVAVLSQPGPAHRGWALLLLDRGRNVSEILNQARAELATRRDVYGWDLLAWALHHSGRDAEAREAMSAALALGTRDAMLFFHAGMIELAAGRREAARERLRTALEINPYWDPFQPAAARAALGELP